MYTVTSEFIAQGMSREGGWGEEQLAILGVAWPPAAGWKLRAIGKEIPEGDAVRFLALRDRHLPPIIVPTPWPAAVYADGGCIQKNPSPHGGTWAYVWVDAAGLAVREDSGILSCVTAGTAEVENNLMETIAIVRCLDMLPDGWEGVVYSDSLNAIRRTTKPEGEKFGGVPDDVKRECFRHRARLPGMRSVLLDGHPTRKHLAAGVGKRGHPVSEWNARCDRLCKAAAAAFLESLT